MRRRLALLLAPALLAGCAAGMPPASAPAPAPAPTVPPAMQYLYGSAEAAGVSEQAFNLLVDAMRAEMARPVHTGAVLAPGATLTDPKALDCAGKPPAAVFDVDETVLLNLGLEYHDAVHPEHTSDGTRLDRWAREGADKVLPVPGAKDALAALRSMGIAVLFNTNRGNDSAAATEDALVRAGLGPAKHLEQLWLKGDVDGQPGKDGRRWAISDKYCVIALGGDQLGDFTDLFTGTAGERRAAAMTPAVSSLFGRRWFILPNPVYGSGLKGGFDDIFPPGMRWEDQHRGGQ
ncbi:MAG: HAD family acid phosphatase [Candidatus Andeanibacterium colombiense]|uniref:HAD family acid phosphatase n=1 Tax=Candidatus Andeanibacterium colombiense TaxID=3121345 RepID=A0AAJ5X6W3_9SPHN|nr:MAG: HAD family acid phosphatase [Sphingomonadaceae bacterium]